MTNEAKYKTVEERVEAYLKHKGLACGTMGHLLAIDYFGWLALEADEEKPEPCPFCGNPCSVCASTHYEYRIVCNNLLCGYHSQAFPKESSEDLIAAHNRVARAVRAAKESEVE